MLDYKEALEYIENIHKKLGSDYSLREVTELAGRVGHPERAVCVIHIAGTNGKGSVGNFISNILAASGYTVGRYVSPTIIDYRERIQRLSQREKCHYISESEVAEAITLLKEQCENMLADGFSQPTAFEIETVMAFLLFRAWKVEIAVVECGLGGRLDATNIVPNPLLCVFTSISMDHRKLLGDSVPKIAGEKYGIVKDNTTVVSKRQTECEKLLREVCLNKKAELIFVREEEIQEKEFSVEKTVFVYKNTEYTLGQGGEFQLENAAIALEAARSLQKKGFFKITEETLREGLFQSRWKGRFEVLSKKPFLLADGAHNEEAAKRLRLSLEKYFPGEKFFFVIGVFRDKEYDKVLSSLLPLAKAVYAVTAPGARGLPCEELCECITGIPSYPCGSMEEALTKALAEEKDGKVVVCGSLSILNGVYQYAANHFLDY